MMTWKEAKENFIGLDIDFSDKDTNLKAMSRDRQEWVEDGMEKQYMKELKTDITGRIIWCWNEIEDLDQISFMCGPETTDGFFSDFFDVYSLLENIFPKGIVEVGAWENGHIIYFDEVTSIFPGFPVGDHLRATAELIDYVDRRLALANAVRVED